MATYSDDDLKKLQKVELDMLRVVDAFCREHGIAYFWTAAPASAPCHGGFILGRRHRHLGMMRDDYERFIRLF